MISFTIPGIPVPQARSRHRIVTLRGGRQFVGQYDPASSRNWKATVAQFARDAMNGANPIAGPVTLEVVFSFLLPASTPKRLHSLVAGGRELAKQTKPDLDNLVKGVVDGCSGIVWRDDAQIATLIARKRFAGKAQVTVDVEEWK